MNKNKKSIIVSLHYHPGLESEIISLQQELNAILFISKKYSHSQDIKNKFNYKLLLKKNICFHIYNTSLFNVFFILHKFLFNSTIVYYFHEPTLKISFKFDFFDNIKSLIVNLIHFLFFLFGDKLMVFSNCGLNKIPHYFSNKIHLRSLPFEINSLIKYRNYTFELSKNEMKILFYGNINSGKNPIHFLKLFHQLYDKRFILRIITTDFKLYEDYSFLKSDKIEILYNNHITDEEIINEIYKCDIILLPHIRCTQSAILEKATFLGKPILFGPCICFEDYVNKYGVRFGNTIHSMMTALEIMYENYTMFQNYCKSRHVISI